jgi:membrane protein implicated in regulation of membrane protease activity
VSSPSGPTDYSATPAPPAGEEIHLPGPTILPLVAAIAITLIVIGTTLDWIFSAVGGVILVIVLVRWVRDTRRDVATLPEEHH